MQGLLEAPLAQGTIGQFGQNHVATVNHGNDRGLMAEFFIMDEYKPFKSAAEGRAIYEPIEMVKIHVPGGKCDVIQRVKFQDDIDGPAHINRFPNQYRAFKSQQEQVPDGTMLEMCKFMASHRVKELKAQGVHTAEQLANTPDHILQNLGMGASRERELCRTFIGNDDEKTRMVSKALADAAEMKDQMELMRQQMAELRAMANGVTVAAIRPEASVAQTQTVPLPGEIFEEAPGPETFKRGPGRPRKES